jgi:SAM-dependent methyltransferase
VRSKPYLGISQTVLDVVKPLLDHGDSYHKVHKARLARTAHIVADLVAEVGEGCKVLELGTSGFLPVTLKSLFPSVAIDVTEYEESKDSNEASVKQKEFGIADKTVTVTAFGLDLEYSTLPVDDETYDIVICCEVLEHMEIDPMFMLAEVNRVLKTGGKLMLTTPNILSSRAITKMVQGYEPYFFMQYHKSREYNRHNYEYSVKGLWAVLKCAGFDPTVWTEDLFEDPLPHTVDMLNYYGFKIANTGDNLLASGVKVSGVVERHPRGLYV